MIRSTATQNNTRYKYPTGIYVSDPACCQQANTLADQINLPIASEKSHCKTILIVSPKGLALCTPGNPALTGFVQVDFSTSNCTRRLQRVRGEQLVKAMGKKTLTPAPAPAPNQPTTNQQLTTTNNIITKQVNNKTNISKASPLDVELANHLAGRIKEHSPNAKVNPLKWAEHIRLMRERDNRDPDEIRKVIDFATADEFWRANILSGKSLRDKFDKLRLKSLTAKKHTSADDKYIIGGYQL